MSKKILNMILFITAIVALAVIVVFFIKLTNIGPDVKDGKTGTDLVDAEGLEDLSALTGKQTDDGPKVPGGTVSLQDLSGITGKQPDPDGSSGVPADKDGDKPTDKPSDTVTEKPTDVPTEVPTATPDVPCDTVTATPLPVEVSKFDPAKPMVALTFDDGPSVNTASIIETLNEYGVHATFFMVGDNVKMYPERVKMVYDAGCEVGNHTVNHKDLKKLSKEEIKKEIEDNQANINAALGITISSPVRPPYGNVNDSVREVCQHPMFNWSVDTLDWKSRNADAVFEEVKKSTKDGSIILMHDLYASTAEAVKQVVPWLIEQGYQICSVSEMFTARGVTLENGHLYNSVMNAQKYLESVNTN